MVSRVLRFLMRRNIEDCKEVRGLASDYIDDDLEQVVRDRVKSHLDWCPPCNAFVRTLRTTVGLLKAAPKAKAAGDLQQRIRDKIREDSRQ